MAEAPRRKLWLDWQRGLAVLYMVEWHTWDSWRADPVASGPVHVFLAIVGGFAAPSFLYMAGLSQFLGDAAQERKGVPVPVRRQAALRRAIWLLGVAYLFRVFEYLAGGAFRVPGGWEGILKVDILNVIAVSLFLSALLTVGLKASRHAVLAATAAAAVAFLAPVVAGWQHPPSRILDYLYSDWPRGIFHLFPWAAFCLAGSALGPLARGEDRPGAWIAIGAALFAAGWAADLLPPVYAHQDFWRTSPSWLSMRLGVVVATSGLLQLVPAGADRWLAWLRTMGRHSLLGYFVSIELPYGVLSARLHKRLGTAAGVVGVLAMVAVTWLASEIAERHDAWRARRSRPAAG
ncbi:MAG TPA: heparan-alpha-glucosaminide N-acetyltransferase domain-containing protein [Anaeromyxobacteraceae bacterium]|nr:heparan-alpha-glucosaminide N-acetyltransferase domain-containing protein [Anaeromyxobacteraceae bacterium]